MAKVTNLTLRHKLAYKIFIRNYSEAGTFQAVIPDLARLKALGVDILILASIFPVTDQHPEGEVGNPNFVKNFKDVEPTYGTMENFKDLVHAVHQAGIQLVIEFPMTQLARDSQVIEERPTYFMRNQEGQVYTRFPGYEKGVDLDFSNPKLWDELIDTLKEWALYVDGFSIRDAQLIRTEFWNSARAEVEDVHPYFYWMGNLLADNTMFRLRMDNVQYSTEGELYSNFDVLDEGNLAEFYLRYYHGILDLDNLIYVLNLSEIQLPFTAVKNRALEFANHPRVASLVKSQADLRNWTAFSLFKKGMAHLIMGQEYGLADPIPWDKAESMDWTVKEDMTEMIQRLSQIKKREACKSGYFFYRGVKPNVIICGYHYYNQHLFGIFKLKADGEDFCEVELSLPQGDYTNLLNDDIYTINEGRLRLGADPVIISYEGDMEVQVNSQADYFLKH
ncbi:alpha-amlyase [Aerococcus loyolae]|uniref:Alpha-amlyase n=1 Tax=Aerococcus urinae TaxID=1376 RepID=A0A2I1L595_9LACT|nr:MULTISPECIES: alpha-amylase family glycosyl hydrolase [Aerococcus]MCY3067720.1 alpha-amylase family glycosyl hydrolase [Aerococcus mictus]MCY3080379.1 alpha-amylase family glycosyl hydrolase [Aerococcus mictus]MDK6728477.1 alpha-amylase family glycosyl hydrolase [Aerococcus urinae]MDK7910529.1 alpha-amylase family glycosyl hydrolase [Aerococcus urinae]MDK8610879.1 alpha-amylase family glycosyl hydrolase [Aerococcus urinae]